MHRVTVFVDWDTARRLASNREQSVRGVEQVFERLQSAISTSVCAKDRRDGYRVYWRIYHGWHQGKTKTQDRLVFEQYARIATARTIKNISFSTDFELSGSLACNSRRTPIFDTCRFDRQSGEKKQKMVDAMLVCDLLHLVRSKDSSLFIVVADDDDFVPAIFTAEAWNANVMLLHGRAQTNSHLSLHGISERMTFQ